MLKIIFIILVIIIAITLAVLISKINKVNRNSKYYKSPAQLGVLYNIHVMLKSYAITGAFEGKLVNCFRLIKGGEVQGVLYGVSWFIIGVCSMILMFGIFCLFSDTWYKVLLGAIFSFVIPILAVRSKLLVKKYRINANLAVAYDLFGSALASNPKVESAFAMAVADTTGATHRIFKRFERAYGKDKEQAFEEYADLIDDQFARTFTDNLREYNRTGVSIVETLNDISRRTQVQYSLILKRMQDMLIFKILGVVYCLLSFGMVKLFSQLGETTMGAAQDQMSSVHMNFTPIYYAIIVAAMIYIIICYLFENF